MFDHHSDFFYIFVCQKSSYQEYKRYCLTFTAVNFSKEKIITVSPICFGKIQAVVVAQDNFTFGSRLWYQPIHLHKA